MAEAARQACRVWAKLLRDVAAGDLNPSEALVRPSPRRGSVCGSRARSFEEHGEHCGTSLVQRIDIP